MMTTAIRIAYLADAPRPYETPVLNELAALADLHVVYMAAQHTQYNFADGWGEAPRFRFSHHWSTSVKVAALDLWLPFSVGVSWHLQRLRPDVLVLKTWNPIALEPLLWKTAARRTCVMWSEETEFSGLLRDRVSNTLRRMIVSGVDAFVTNGTAATRYLRALGVSASRIVPSCLPSKLADDAVAQPSPRRCEPERLAGPRFLYVGRLIPRKQPLELLRAFDQVRRALPSATLTVVGDGPLLDSVSRAAAVMDGSVTVLGRREGSELAAVYSTADILILPALREVWGLVVNEALAHGLFVIASDQVGSAYDLLDESSGMIVPAADPAAWTAAMIQAGRALSRDERVRALRRRRASGCTTACFAQAIYRAAQMSLRR